MSARDFIETQFSIQVRACFPRCVTTLRRFLGRPAIRRLTSCERRCITYWGVAPVAGLSIVPTMIVATFLVERLLDGRFVLFRYFESQSHEYTTQNSVVDVYLSGRSGSRRLGFLSEALD